MDPRTSFGGGGALAADFQRFEYERVRLVCSESLSSTLDMRAPVWRRLLHPDERAERCVGIVRLVDERVLVAAEIMRRRPTSLWRELARGDAAELAAAVNARSEQLWRGGWRYLKPYRGSPFHLSPSLLEGVLRYYSEGGFAREE